MTGKKFDAITLMGEIGCNLIGFCISSENLYVDKTADVLTPKLQSTWIVHVRYFGGFHSIVVHMETLGGQLYTY